MKIIRYPQKQALKTSSCVTIGNFDGVHLGHQKLIENVVHEARKRSCLSVVVTMQPLPQQYFGGTYSLDLLTGFKQKALLLERLGVDVMCCLNFNDQLANTKAHEFYANILKNGLCSQYILVGDDFRFGHQREGCFELLQLWAKHDAITVKQLSSIEVGEMRVSSTQIRQLLSEGCFQQAKQLLGRDFNLIGRVAHGRKKGRELGFPTINIELKNGGFPLHGIYHTHIKINGCLYPSVTSVGYNPTVGGNAKRVEVHVFDFSQDVYGQTVEVLFYKKLRNEVEFGSLTELTDAIAQDVKVGREFFATK